MTLQIDTLAYTNRLRGLPPEPKLLFAIALLIITYITHPPIQLLITLWLGVWVIVYAKIPASIYLKLLFIPASFWLTSLPALVLSGVAVADLSTVQLDVWQGFRIGHVYFYLSRQGIDQAEHLLARAIASTSCIYFAMLTVPFNDLLQLLRRLGCPTLLTDLLLLMYRFIFMLLRIASELWTAQHARNGYRTWRTSMNSMGLLVSQLLKRTLNHYHDVSLSLASRGFSGEFRVWHSRSYHYSRRYLIEAVLGCVILIVLSFES